MYPDSCIIRFDWAARGVHPPLSLYWYDGNLPLPVALQTPAPRRAGPLSPEAVARRSGRHGLDWHEGHLSRGPRALCRPNTEPLPAPPQREWGREEVHKDWAVAALKRASRRPAISAMPVRSPKPTNWQHRAARRPSDPMGSPGFPRHQLPGSQPVPAPRIPEGLGSQGNRRQRVGRARPART